MTRPNLSRSMRLWRPVWTPLTMPLTLHYNNIDGKIKKVNQPLTLLEFLLEDLMHSEVGDVEASPAGDDPSQEEDHRDYRESGEEESSVTSLKVLFREFMFNGSN